MESINRPIYRFFSFRTSERMASEYGHCSGQVNLQTGEILANISYGLFHYPETYQLNLADSISQFPHTTKELIICAARHAANEEGVRGMTRRRVIFVCKDGRRYITEEYSGDRSEYAARGRCLDSCDMDWPEIRDIFQEPATYTQFIKANLRAQAAYHSFRSENGNSGIVRNLRKGREGPYADKILFVYAAPLATGGRIFETNYTCFTPVPGLPYPACTGQGKKPCLECPLRQSFQTAELAQLQAEHNWPRAVHTDGDDAEDLLAGGVGGGEVALVVYRLNINGTLLGVDAEIAALRRAAAQVSDQLVLKAAAVEALEDHLAELAQDHFTHGGSSPYRPCAPLPRWERRYYF